LAAPRPKDSTASRGTSSAVGEKASSVVEAAVVADSVDSSDMCNGVLIMRAVVGDREGSEKASVVEEATSSNAVASKAGVDFILVNILFLVVIRASQWGRD
jgi:hypothetical protein